MNLIVNVDRQWGIGKDGDQPFHIPADMRFFREKTLGGAVILGRKTLATFPHGRPLPGRTNIVLSRSIPAEENDSLIVCSSIEEAQEAAAEFPPEQVWVIGGEQVYRLMLPMCDTAYVTLVEADAEADRFMPNLDEASDWQQDKEIASGTDGGLTYTIRRYRRICPASIEEDQQ